MIEIPKYRGITYHFFLRYLINFRWFRKFWRNHYCRKEQHLFDEVVSGGSSWRHYLVCDACQLMINIEKIDDTYVKDK